MDIKILGTGCAKCKKLTEVAEQMAKELGIQYTLEKVTDMEKIVTFSVMSTPALVINGEVKAMGRIPSRDDLKKMMS